MKRKPAYARNSTVRPRGEWLTPEEMQRVLKAARASGEHAERNYTMVLLAYQHGLRASELCGMTWDQIDLAGGQIMVKRLKGCKSTMQPLQANEGACLRRLKRPKGSRLVFASERGPGITRRRFAQIVRELGEAAGIPFPIHPHMLRHACGYWLANQGKNVFQIKNYLGHRRLEQAEEYCQLNPNQFKGLFDHS